MENHPSKAVHAALQIRCRLQELNSQFEEGGLPTLGVRIGINTAAAFVGTMGSTSRLNYTVVGEGVNTASQLESINNEYKTKMLIGEQTAIHPSVQSQFSLRWIDKVKLKGMSNAQHIFEVVAEKGKTTVEEDEEIELHNRLR